MALRKQAGPDATAARREDMLAAAEAETETVADRAMRAFLRRLTAATWGSLAQAVPRPVVAAGEPIGADLFSLGQARGWWEDSVDEELIPQLRQTWAAGYSETSTVSSSTDAAARYLAQVKDRLSPTATPGLPEAAFDKARVALAEELARGSGIPAIRQRLAAEFSWDDPATYWRTQKKLAQDQIDAKLDRIGPPGDEARELAKRTDPEIKALRASSNEATKHIDAVESTWKVRATRIARTETTGAFNAGAYQAYHDEGVEAVQWLAASDARTRPTHAAASGQIVALGTPFQVGSAQLLMPGDPSGPAREVINCRCTTIGADLPEGMAPAPASPALPASTSSAPAPASAQDQLAAVRARAEADQLAAEEARLAAERQAALQAKMEAAAAKANQEAARQAELQAKMEAAARRANEAAAAKRAAEAAAARLAAEKAAREAQQAAAAKLAAEKAAQAAKAAAEAQKAAAAAKVGGIEKWKGQPAPAAPLPPVGKFGVPKKQYDAQVKAWQEAQALYKADHDAWVSANTTMPAKPKGAPVGPATAGPRPALQGMASGTNRTTAWANRNLPEFTGPEAQVVSKYTGDSYKPWNAALRNAGKAGTDPRDNKRYGQLTRRLDEALDQHRLPETIRVHRATSAREFAFPEGAHPKDLTKLIGSTQVQDGYLSTSIGTKSAFDGDVHIAFVAPKGTPMGWVDPISKHKGEREMLGARGLRYVIHDVKFNKTTGKWHVSAEILPVD